MTQKYEQRGRVANSKVWWRTNDTLWVISDQNNLPTKCGFLVELGPPRICLLYAVQSGHLGRCWCGLRNLSKFQTAAGSIWFKTRGLLSSCGPPWIHPGGYLTTCDIYCAGSLTVHKGSPSHGHLKKSHKLVNYPSTHERIASGQFSLSSTRVKTVVSSDGIKDPCCLSKTLSHITKCSPHVTYDIIWLMGL